MERGSHQFLNLEQMGERGETSVELIEENHGGDYQCPNTSCPESRRIPPLDYFDSPIVGLKRAPYGFKPMAAVCECPGCNEKFWFHVESIDVPELIKIVDKNTKKYATKKRPKKN